MWSLNTICFSCYVRTIKTMPRVYSHLIVLLILVRIGYYIDQLLCNSLLISLQNWLYWSIKSIHVLKLKSPLYCATLTKTTIFVNFGQVFYRIYWSICSYQRCNAPSATLAKTTIFVNWEQVFHRIYLSICSYHKSNALSAKSSIGYIDPPILIDLFLSKV